MPAGQPDGARQGGQHDPLSGAPEDIFRRSRTIWSVESGLPKPSVPLRCPLCVRSYYGVRYWQAFDRTSDNRDHRIDHRVDVGLKCGVCGDTRVCGVPVTPEEYEAAPQGAKRGRLHVDWG